MKIKRPLVLLIALIIGIVSLAFTFTYMDNTMDTVKTIDTKTPEDSGKALGLSLGVTMAIPHLIASAVATLFCALSWFFKLRWAAITAGVFYAIAIALMLPWFYLVIVQMILCFIGAGILGKQKRDRAIERKLKQRP
ncbi:MAG: hypothetical protein ACOX54_08595 [Christensenellales bacterium]|jgi:hypothetical protein|nr:hypothetical protein [Christensenellaceae bacterium]